MDENPKLASFASTLEECCVSTVQNGQMTKDLALLAPDKPKWLNSSDFLSAVATNLEMQLN